MFYTKVIFNPKKKKSKIFPYWFDMKFAMGMGKKLKFIGLSILSFLILSFAVISCERKPQELISFDDVRFKVTDWTNFRYDRQSQSCRNAHKEQGYNKGLATECVDFSNQKLNDLTFDGLNFMGANFINSQLIKVSFKKANLLGAKFNGATLKSVSWTDALFDDDTILPFDKSEALSKGMIYFDSSQIDREIRKRIENNNPAEVKLLLDLRATSNLKDPLFLAIDLNINNHEIIRMLVEHGASLDDISSSGYTPLSSLIDRLKYVSQPNIVIDKIKFILSLGADPNFIQENEIKSSALYKAITSPIYIEELVSLLFQFGANPNQKGIGCDSIIKEVKNPSVLKLFMNYGAELEGVYFGGACRNKSHSYLYSVLTDNQRFSLNQNISPSNFVLLLQFLSQNNYKLTQIEKSEGKSILASALESLSVDPQKLILIHENILELKKAESKDGKNPVSLLMESYVKRSVVSPQEKQNALALLDIFKKIQLDFVQNDRQQKNLFSRLLDQENFRNDEVISKFLGMVPLAAWKENEFDNPLEKLLRKSQKRSDIIQLLPLILQNSSLVTSKDKWGNPLISLCESEFCFFQFVDAGFDLEMPLQWYRSTFLVWFLKTKFKFWPQERKFQWLKKSIVNERILNSFKKNKIDFGKFILQSDLSSEQKRELTSDYISNQKDDYLKDGDWLSCADQSQKLYLNWLDLLSAQEGRGKVELLHQVSPIDLRFWNVEKYQIKINKDFKIFIFTEQHKFVFYSDDLKKFKLKWDESAEIDCTNTQKNKSQVNQTELDSKVRIDLENEIESQLDEQIILEKNNK